MKRLRSFSLMACALLSACGGGGGGSTLTTSPAPVTGGTPTPSPTPTPTPTTAGCTLRERQLWAAEQLREWYLFPETLPAVLDPAAYTTVQEYLDALTATARGQRKDRFFTYITSIREEDAFNASGATAGFGFRLVLDSSRTRVFVGDSFEGAPALAGGVDRGAEILAIGNSSSSLRTIDQIARDDGNLSNALGPDTPGTARTFRIGTSTGTREVTLTKADYDLQPVSPRFGTQVLTANGRQYGYVNLRTFITTAEAQLVQAFLRFKTAGITDVVIDFRYNGGGLLSTAGVLSDLLGGARSTSDVQSYIAYRPEKASQNQTRLYRTSLAAISPTRLAFLTGDGTASASELVINVALPYLGARVGMVGANTFGKPVGQIALDRPACDDRLRVVALATQNSARQGDYYDGLATKVQTFCPVAETLSQPMGSLQEALTRAGLGFLAGGNCTTAIASAGPLRAEGPPVSLTPPQPSVAQREVPGLF